MKTWSPIWRVGQIPALVRRKSSPLTTSITHPHPSSQTYSVQHLFEPLSINDIPKPPPRRDPLEGYCFDEFEPAAESHKDAPSPLSLRPKSPLADPEPVIPGLDTTEYFLTSTPGPDPSSGIMVSTVEVTHPNTGEGTCMEGGRCAQPKLEEYGPECSGCAKRLKRLKAVEGKESPHLTNAPTNCQSCQLGCATHHQMIDKLSHLGH